MTERKLTCQEAIQQLFTYLDRELEGEPLEALESHLGSCLDCCDRLEFSRKLDVFVKERLGNAPVPGDIEDRIRRILAG